MEIDDIVGASICLIILIVLVGGGWYGGRLDDKCKCPKGYSGLIRYSDERCPIHKGK